MQKNLFLWGHPRSLSTAMELYFRSRGDYDVIHEPFANSYWKGESANSARQSLLDSLARSSQPVFVKDIAHHVRFDGLREAGFLNRFEHIILVRSPLATFRSHLAVNPEVKPHEFGYQALYDLYMRLGQRLHCAPIVISVIPPFITDLLSRGLSRHQ